MRLVAELYLPYLAESIDRCPRALQLSLPLCYIQKVISHEEGHWVPYPLCHTHKWVTTS
jgi:hypothetical protein